MTKNPTHPEFAIKTTWIKVIPTTINPENPLKRLKEFQKKTSTQYPSIDQLPDIYRERVRLLFWTQYLANSLPLLWKISKSVFTDEFNLRMKAILWDHRIHLDWLTTESRRVKSWSLEVYWNTHDIPATDHHLIPRSRGWINHERNYLRLPEDHHKDFHKIFWTLTPIEQIAHITLCFREHFSPGLIVDLCGILQDQNAQYEPFLLEYGKVKYPAGIHNFIQKWN